MVHERVEGQWKRRREDEKEHDVDRKDRTITLRHQAGISSTRSLSLESSVFVCRLIVPPSLNQLPVSVTLATFRYR